MSDEKGDSRLAQLLGLRLHGTMESVLLDEDRLQDTREIPQEHESRYNLEENIAVSRFSSVELVTRKPHKFETKNRRFQSDLAAKICKVKKDDESEDSEDVYALDRPAYLHVIAKEVNILKSLHRHKHVVRLHEAFHLETTTKNEVWMVFEYVRFELETLLVVLHPLTEEEIAAITFGVLTALIYIHSLNIIHKDIKSENILITRTGLVKLCDFGLSKVAPPEDGPLLVDTIEGTLETMAPELHQKQREYDVSADIWSLGVVVYHLWKGTYGPFEDPLFWQTIDESFEANEFLYHIKTVGYFDRKTATAGDVYRLSKHGIDNKELKRLASLLRDNYSVLKFCSTCLVPRKARLSRATGEQLLKTRLLLGLAATPDHYRSICTTMVNRTSHDISEESED